jgi:hypothetical protein
MNRPFRKVGFLGLIVVGMSLFLGTVFPGKAPWMMDGFSTPIIAFEFVQSKDEVNRLFGLANPSEQQSGQQSASSMIKAMDSGNRLDYVYMVLYASFLFFFSLICTRITGQKLYYAASVIAVFILFADGFENIQLLSITSKINNLDFGKELTALHWFTWIKWGGISIVFLILAPYFLKGRLYSKLIAGAGLLSFSISVLAYFNRSVLNELMGLSVALMFVMMIVYCFIYKIET